MGFSLPGSGIREFPAGPEPLFHPFYLPASHGFLKGHGEKSSAPTKFDDIKSDSIYDSIYS